MRSILLLVMNQVVLICCCFNVHGWTPPSSTPSKAIVSSRDDFIRRMFIDAPISTLCILGTTSFKEAAKRGTTICNNREAWKYINYVECSNQGYKSQFAMCLTNGIEGYPEWKFGNGKNQGGEMELIDIAILSGYISKKGKECLMC